MKRRPKICFFSIDLNNWFGEALLRGALSRCRRHQFDLFVVDGGTLDATYEWEYQRNRLYSMIDQQAIDALLVANVFGIVSPTAAQEFLVRFSDIPVVTLSEKFPGMPAVRIDNTRGFRDLVRHLVEVCGSRSFAAITGPANNFDSNERLSVLREVLKSYNLPLDSSAVYEGDFSDTCALRGVGVLLDERRVKFDTLVCFNDYMAVSAMENLLRRGYDVPRDIRVTGFDDTCDSLYSNPPLTTVHNPVQELAGTAVDVLRDLLRGKPTDELTILHSSFVPRLSGGEAYVQKGKKSPGPADETDNSAGVVMAPEAVLRLCAGWGKTALEQATAPVSDKDKAWFQDRLKMIVEHLFRENDADIGEFMEKNIYAERKNEWSAELWVSVCQQLHDFVDALPEPDRKRFLPKASSLRDLVKMYRSLYFSNEQLRLQKMEKFLFIMGEALASVFELEKIGPILEYHTKNLGIQTCFVSIFTDSSLTRARLIVSLENDKLTDAKNYGEFPSRGLLPKPLWDKYPALTMNALHVRDETIGFFFINTGDHPGILYESLRHQLSTAVKGTQLVTTINRYSAGLEQMVQERTEELQKVNRELKNQIERRELAEKELLKQKNLESLSLLAGGIAHDFNNILTVLSGNLSLLREAEQDAAYRQNRYELMRKAVENAKGLTYQLLTFAKGGMPVKQTMLVEPLIEETAKFILHGSRIKPVFDFSGGPSSVDIDHNQISQVLNNVILNAIQTMPDGGSIVFRIRHEQTPEALPYRPEGAYVKISIIDSGSGIHPDIIDRIFDPYFTTKQEGSGLGLSTSLAIIRKHGGDITVASTPGKGSVFTIYLPLSRKAPKKTEQEENVLVPAGLRVLVLEDNESVAEIFAQFLKKCGEEYVITASGEETVTLFLEAKKKGAPFDLVITDLTISGGMSGAEVMRKLLQTDGDVRGIVTSGYSEVPVLAEHKRYGFRSVLQKPFTFEEFAKAIMEALSGP